MLGYEHALRVSRSHVLEKKHRSSDCADRRRSPTRADDTHVKQAIADVVQKRATYGYRTVWTGLKFDGRTCINHKRFYPVLRDFGWLLFRQGQMPLVTRKHEDQVPVKESNTRWCSDLLELSGNNDERVIVAFVLDSCDRKVMTWVATTKDIDAKLVGDLMM